MVGFLVQAAGGGLIRFLLFRSEYRTSIAERIEVSTPHNSWKRVVEGSYLQQHGTSPYDGDLFHTSPIDLYIYDGLLKLLDPFWLPAVFILWDILTAWCLSLAAFQFTSDLMAREAKEKKKHAADSSSLLIKPTDSAVTAKCVFGAYLFNPYVVLNCVGQTTTVFGNLCIAAGLLSMVKGMRLFTCIFLAFAAYQSFYPVMLLIPAALYLAGKENSAKLRSCLATFTLYSVVIGLFLWTSKILVGNWSFLHSTYGFILTVPDLTPNIGLFWYFFTEMFEHFRLLFICTFQINAFVYVVPLVIRFYNEPMLLAYSFCSLIAIFKSYSCLGDVGMYLAMLPMWRHLHPFMQQSFIVGCIFTATSVLAPILWHLWIYAGSANANFFFSVTLAFGTAQIFLLTDVLFAYTKREFHLKNGLKKEINGKPAKLILE